MKKTCLLGLVLLTLFLGACGANTTQAPQGTTTQPLDEETAAPLESEMIECSAEEGFVTAESLQTNTPCQVRTAKYLSTSQGDGFSYDLYIEVDTPTAQLQKLLVAGVIPEPWDTIYLADVDGDGTAEILIHENTGGCGGYGLWRTWVLKVENGEIRTLFENYNEFDTGFESRYLENAQLEVTNRITGYSLVFDRKEIYNSYPADTDPNMMIDPFYHFVPEDVDADGVYEILCKSYTSILSHSDYTGSACCVLKYDTQTQSFQVADAWYEPNPDA